MQGHTDGRESLRSNKVSGKTVALPFKRKLTLINGTYRVAIPKAYVKNFRLDDGKEKQLYIEVSA